VRGLLVAVVLAFVVLVGGPAAYAADTDYPPGSPGIGVPSRPAEPISGLPRTGNDISRQLALGIGLIVTGGVILIAVRRRRAPSR
jgi:LPXTG-motif cell wall-anchored protein